MVEPKTTAAEAIAELQNPGAGEEASKAAGEEKANGGEEAKTPKTFTEEQWNTRETEWNKRYSGLDTKLTKTSQEYEARIGKLDEEIQRTVQEAAKTQDAKLIEALKEAGGDPEVVESIFERVTNVRTKELANSQKEVELANREKILSEAGKNKTALDLVKEYELGEDSLEKLLESETPEGMKASALELKLEKLKAAATVPDKVDETDTKSGIELGDLPASEALGKLMEAEERRKAK